MNTDAMGHPIGILFLHGIGRTQPGYSRPLAEAIASRFARSAGEGASDPQAELLFEEVNWSAALQPAEDDLGTRLREAATLRWGRLRGFMLDFAADAIAYQPTHSDRSAYDAIHGEVAASLGRLAKRAGARAPLCVIGHSLGTVIASNYLYDLMKPRKSFMAPDVRGRIGRTPIERGETLSLFYTMGSPIALWSLRYPGFGVPVSLPVKRLAGHHPDLRPRWVNFYDPDDVIGYPLKPLNELYDAAVDEDRAVDVGSWLTRWNPLSHTGYWGDGAVADLIAHDVAETWGRSSAIGLMPARKRSAGARRAASAR
jgi:hypothetical protein